MNRRHFLQSIAALGCTIALPVGALASASEAAIDEAWQAASSNPLTFYVNSSGAISFSNDEEWQKSRSELLGLLPPRNRADLIELADENWRLAAVFERKRQEWLGEGRCKRAHWRTLLRQASDDTLEELLYLANGWIDKTADAYDWEEADHRGLSDRGAALAFFRDEFAFSDAFNIAIVEGAHPGSSYYAAELRMDVDAANAAAVVQGVPVRFEQSGD